MGTTWTPPPQTFKDRFVKGWETYVRPPFSVPPKQSPADFYWNPRAGVWYAYPTSTHDVQDKSWPKTDISRTDTVGVLDNPGKTFEQITDQYMALPVAEQWLACWDPRRAQWMAVRLRGTVGTDDKHAPLNQFLQQLEAVRRHLGHGSYETIRKAITDEM